MKILFSPSEGKKEGGSGAAMTSKSFCFETLYTKRLEVLNAYRTTISEADETALCKLFGLKDTQQCKAFKEDIFNAPTMKAVERYDGVAFEYLHYASLPASAQRYIDENCMIFSNLFGPLRADNMIPRYKLKQGEKITGLAIEQFYKKHFSAALDAWLQNDEVLDLRAGYYLKFYKPKKRVITMKFMKNGKVVSHWAKAYRGVVLQSVARQNIQDFGALETLAIDGLSLQEVQTSKREHLMLYAIQG